MITGELAIICRIATNARVISTLVCTAISLRNTLESITTPCSVKASGKADFGRLFFDVITNCDEITTHSSADRYGHTVAQLHGIRRSAAHL